MAEHTPGPWLTHYDDRHPSDGRPRIVLHGNTAAAASKHDAVWIADINPDLHQDAALIAAAPDMEDALQLWADVFRLWASAWPWTEEPARSIAEKLRVRTLSAADKEIAIGILMHKAQNRGVAALRKGRGETEDSER